MKRCERHKTNYSISCSRCESENDILSFGDDFIMGGPIEVVPGQLSIFDLEEESEQ